MNLSYAQIMRSRSNTWRDLCSGSDEQGVTGEIFPHYCYYYVLTYLPKLRTSNKFAFLGNETAQNGISLLGLRISNLVSRSWLYQRVLETLTTSSYGAFILGCPLVMCEQGIPGSRLSRGMPFSTSQNPIQAASCSCQCQGSASRGRGFTKVWFFEAIA